MYDRGVSKYEAAPTVAAGLIRLARQKASLTQTELAESVGLTQQAVSAYETGRHEPTLPSLLRLIYAAGLELRMHLEAIDDHDLALIRRELELPPHERLSRMVDAVNEVERMMAAADGVQPGITTESSDGVTDLRGV